MTTAVITIAAGRHQHLWAQQRGLALGDRRPDVYVAVAMGDPQVGPRTVDGPLTGTGEPVSSWARAAGRPS